MFPPKPFDQLEGLDAFRFFFKAAGRFLCNSANILNAIIREMRQTDKNSQPSFRCTKKGTITEYDYRVECVHDASCTKKRTVAITKYGYSAIGFYLSLGSSGSAISCAASSLSSPDLDSESPLRFAQKLNDSRKIRHKRFQEKKTKKSEAAERMYLVLGNG